MATASTPEPSSEPASALTRFVCLAVVALLAAVIVLSARAEGPGSPRLGGRIELIELIRQEQARTQALRERVDELAAEVASVQRANTEDGTALAVLQSEVDELVAPAGMTGLSGPGLTVTLRDSTAEPARDSDYNDYVIHEQDLQAVINALWAGGAEGLAVNGNRVLTTTAIRCVGNVLLLHGATYSPPYVIAAVGDPVSLREELGRDTAVAGFVQAVRTFELGFEVAAGRPVLPAYQGGATMQVAEPVEEEEA